MQKINMCEMLVCLLLFDLEILTQSIFYLIINLLKHNNNLCFNSNRISFKYHISYNQ